LLLPLFKIIYQEKIKISLDFVLDKANLNKFELTSRFKHFGKIFDAPSGGAATGNEVAKEAEENKEDEEEDPNLEAEFAVKYNELRLLINDIAKPRLHKIFRDRAKLLCGSKYTHCETLSDWLHEYKHGPYDNQKRWMVNCLINEMWVGQSMPMVEKITMETCGLDYLELIICQEKGQLRGQLVPPKTKRSCGSIRKNLQRLKGTLFVEPFR
jgi:hypothetical protein